MLACAGFWIWSRYVVVKQPLGGPCKWAIDCGKEAPRCMRPDVDEPGICSRACALPDDCAPGIRCVEVELDDRDEHGNYVKAGTCMPQTFLDARKAKARGDAGAAAVAASDSWVEVPEGEGVLEGELTLRGKTWLVKGALVRTPEGEGTRRIVDTSALRTFTVDDKKKTFAASAVGASGAGDDVTVTKTERKDRVADRECEIWQLVEKKARREACILHGASFVEPGVATIPGWQKELTVRAALPLRIVELDAKGNETARTEARFAAKKLDRALFAIPKSYKNVR